MAGRKHVTGRLYAALERAERDFWQQAIRAARQPVTVRGLAKYVGASAATVSRRLRLLGYRFESVLVKNGRRR